ncbi:MAG: InlB B-repeat-containing protein [Clostridia bacterium]|nr:InlB B-repeat-containing protein [Clostridia bacterium]
MKRKIIFLTIFLAITLGLTSCFLGGFDTDTSTQTNTETDTEEFGDYIVTFDTQGGSYVPPQRTNKDNKIKEPEPPTKEGNTFDGWYHGNWKWDFKLQVATEDTTIVARWIPDINLVHAESEVDGVRDKYFTVGGGPFEYGDETECWVEPREGHTFLGWYDGDTLITHDYRFTAIIKEEKTFVAKWHKNSIIFKADYYGEFEPTMQMENGEEKRYYNDIMVAEIGDTMVVSADVREGYIFDGWYKDGELISSENKITVEFNGEGQEYYLKLKEDPVLALFEFDNPDHFGCRVNGIKDKTLTEVYVPDIVDCIWDGAFEDCSNIESISLPFIGTNRYAIGSVITTLGVIFGTKEFEGASLVWQYQETLLTGPTPEYYIPDSLRVIYLRHDRIPLGAFSNCEMLEEIYFEKGLLNIPERAFYNCTGLKTIYYNGTQAEWDALEKGEFWDHNTTFEVVFLKEE